MSEYFAWTLKGQFIIMNETCFKLDPQKRKMFHYSSVRIYLDLLTVHAQLKKETNPFFFTFKAFCSDSETLLARPREGWNSNMYTYLRAGLQ